MIPEDSRRAEARTRAADKGSTQEQVLVLLLAVAAFLVVLLA